MSSSNWSSSDKASLESSGERCRDGFSTTAHTSAKSNTAQQQWIQGSSWSGKVYRTGLERSHALVRYSVSWNLRRAKKRSRLIDSISAFFELQGQPARNVTTGVTENRQLRRGEFHDCDRKTLAMVACHIRRPVLQIGYPIQATPRRVSYYPRSGFPSQRLSQLPESSRKRPSAFLRLCVSSG
jgi:hypothetical protein